MDAKAEAAFHEYVVERTERLVSFAYLCCGDWHQAEDVVQTALIKLYGAWGRAQRYAVEPYVRRIIVNALTDQRRLAWFRRVRVGDEGVAEPVSTSDGRGRTEDRLLLVDALQRLPKRQRAAVVLRYWEDLPVEQTARILNCSTGAVKNLTLRGLAALRGILTTESAPGPVLAELEGIPS